MDFLSNLIKRPNSIALPEPNPEPDPGTKTEAAAEPEATTESPTSCGSSATTALLGSTPSSSSSPSPTSLITLAMDRCSIDTGLENLFDAAAQELDCLEQQHNDIIAHVEADEEDKPNSTRDTIKQLLNEINLNLDQVTAREMEHLQAMSLELSPLAVKPTTTRHSLDQQKALLAAMRSTPQPDAPSSEQQKFTGLPEFDETQIPELAALSSETEAQLKPGSTLSSTLLKSSENDYNSDSDVYAECLSLNSGKLSADYSELEAYSSALNVLEQHMSHGAPLDKTLSEAGTAHNDSCEPMDVDDINETMEILKDVLAPEDHQMLQQQFLGGAMLQEQQETKEEPQQVFEQQQQGLQKEPTNETKEEPETLEVKEEQPKMENQPEPHKEVEVQLSKEEQGDVLIKLVAPASPPSPSLEQPAPTTTEADPLLEEPVPCPVPEPAVKPPSPEIATLPSSLDLKGSPVPQALEPIAAQTPPPPVKQLPTSPPIPTLRQKTPEELEILMAIEAYAQPPNPVESPEKPVEAIQSSSLAEEQDRPISPTVPIVTVTPKAKLFPTLDMNVSKGSHGSSSRPTSPAFPIKSPEESPTHFPRSPRAPAEREEMQYLEQAIIEPSSEHQQLLSGVIAKSPLPIELTVTQPSPEKPPQEQELNSTMPVGRVSPLNGTFDSASPDRFEALTACPSVATFGVPLDAGLGEKRRTFSVNVDQQKERLEPKRHSDSHVPEPGQEESHLNATYGMPLEAATGHQRRTFCMQTSEKEEQQLKGKRQTFCMDLDASPALEATEENIMSNDLEPMDVDMSLRVEADTQERDFAAQLAEAQAVALPPAPPSPPLPAQRRQQPHPELEQSSSPPLPAQLKRRAIHPDAPLNAAGLLEKQKLSVKEQLHTGDEKEDVYVEHFGAMSPISDEIFKQPQAISNVTKVNKKAPAAASVSDEEQFYDADFQDGAANNNIILNSLDFDYLYTKGSNNSPIDRSSLLLKFDPLLGAPVPVNQSSQQQQEQALLSILNSNNNNNNNIARALSPTLEEHESSNQSFSIDPCAKGAPAAQKEFKPPVDRSKKHAKMSVDVIDNDCNKTFDNSSLNSEEKTHKYHNMDELEKKIKNEVTRSEDIEKKLKEAEQREEALVKRITEKDKTNAKLNGVIEAYEKAIAELISDKEQLVQNHERQMLEVQTDRDSNYHHLTSLETTFSDLHVKYEKSKEMTSHLKQVEENLLEEKKKLMDKLRQQEQRYEQMKSHAMQQMEIANKKLATLTKEHTDEVKKLKALLKKEEVSRISTAEQLQQKSRENADLLKICEELIYDKGQGGSS